MKLNKDAITQFIPHRDPFLFLDQISAINLPKNENEIKDLKDLIGTEVKGQFFVRPELEILKGHFPGNPILPGVVQTEMMAQCSIFVTYPLFKHLAKVDLEVALLGVDKARYRRPVKPGMSLHISSRFLKGRGTMMSFECAIDCDELRVSECEILANFQVNHTK